MKGGRTKSKLSCSVSDSATSPGVKASEARLSDRTSYWFDSSEIADSISIEYVPGFGNQDSIVCAVSDLDSLSSIDTSLILTRGLEFFDDNEAKHQQPHDHISSSLAETETNSLDRKQPSTASAQKKKDRWKAKTASRPDK